MNPEQIMKIFADTAYVRSGGRESEKKAAYYLQEQIRKMGLESHLECFEVPVSDVSEAVLEVDGISVPCKGYLCCGSGDVEAPFYYLRHDDAWSLKQCKGKIVMMDGYMGYWRYQDILEHGAVGFITHDGNVNYTDFDMDHRELRSYVHKGNRLLGVNTNTKYAVELIQKGAKTAKIHVRQNETVGTSQNVVLEIPGELDEYIVFTAHYDSTSLSQGAYDNMSGSIGLLGLAEYFKDHPHRYGMRFIWCGSEERGLLGAKAYCIQHEAELEKIALNINLDMIGCIMGKFLACATAEEKLVHYIQYFGAEKGIGIHAYQDVYSSDSTAFADRGVPAVSFARIAPNNCGTIHNRYDTMALMSGEQMIEDIDFLIGFTDRMANAVLLPVEHVIPENMKDKLNTYLFRKRPEKK